MDALKSATRLLTFTLLLVLTAPSCHAQTRPGKASDIKGLTVPDNPEHPEPAARDFRDRSYGVAFHVPAGWNFERKDGILSNFGKDVRSARRGLDVRGVAAINFNPYPPTTFAGAMFYYSVLPHSDANACAVQATTGHLKPKADVPIGGVVFKHGQDQHGTICTESRDEVFTALRGRSCLRFDLVVNTFCAQSSGAMEITPDQLGDVNTRLGNMLGSIRIDPH
jgi:hypothetical protein